METRPPNIEGKGEIRQRELVKNALRMRPDRIILGECRGEEAFDMLQAMNTGHEGSMATIHANTPRDAISRLEQMIGMAGLPMTVASIRSQIANAIQLIVQLQRQSDGKRKVTSIAEVTGLEGDIIQMQEIFKFVRSGTAPDGTVQGCARASFLTLRIWELPFLAAISTPRSSSDLSWPTSIRSICSTSSSASRRRCLPKAFTCLSTATPPTARRSIAASR
jgi:pilus assembly protein CpaF